MQILDKLIEQAKNPKGIIGTAMLNIMNSAHSSIINEGLSKINIPDDAVILDVGCGGGKAVQLLSCRARNGKIYGVDYSADAVKTATKENADAVCNGQVIIRQGSVSSLPFASSFFDIITAFQTHYFWPDLKNDIREISRVLKPNGQFVLAAEADKIDYHMTEYKTTQTLESLLLASGFTTVRAFETEQELCFVGTK